MSGERPSIAQYSVPITNKLKIQEKIDLTRQKKEKHTENLKKGKKDYEKKGCLCVLPPVV